MRGCVVQGASGRTSLHPPQPFTRIDISLSIYGFMLSTVGQIHITSPNSSSSGYIPNWTHFFQMEGLQLFALPSPTFPKSPTPKSTPATQNALCLPILCPPPQEEPDSRLASFWIFGAMFLTHNLYPLIFLSETSLCL